MTNPIAAVDDLVKLSYFRDDWQQRVARGECPVCPGGLDTGWECNRCGFDAMPIALTEGTTSQ